MSKNNDKVSFWKLLNEKKIIIPIIQRDYAQGREGKEFLRERFLGQLFDALKGTKPLVLDFVYGSVEADTFYPLDGQQRLTALWLLHWYLALYAGTLPEDGKMLKRFSYETRISSRTFCQKLCSVTQSYQPQTHGIATFVRNQTWFYSAYEQDPTIQSMLRMLNGTDISDSNKMDITDGIEEYCIKTGLTKEKAKELLKRLKGEDAPISFYLLNMEDKNMPLTDDLYIKMNARGKVLTDFENFKVDLLKKIDELTNKEWNPENGMSKENFSLLLDTRWTDLFWHYRSTECHIDEIYLNFLNRFFLNWYIARCNTDATPKEVTARDFYKQLSAAINGKNKDYRYQSVSIYNQVLTRECIASLQTCLNRLCDLYQNAEGGDNKQKLQAIDALFMPYWEEFAENGESDKANKIFSFIPRYATDDNTNTPVPITLKQQVVFHAICVYLTNCKEVETDKLKDWVHFVWNMAENSYMDSEQSVGAIRFFDTELNKLPKIENNEAPDQASDNIIDYLAGIDEGQIKNVFGRRQLLEEIAKAKQIKQDPAWKDTIHEAEKTAFFKGAIAFLFINEKGETDWTNFDTKRDTAQQLFDKDGVKADKIVDAMQTLYSYCNDNDWDSQFNKDAKIFNGKANTWKDQILTKVVGDNKYVYAKPVHYLLMRVGPSKERKEGRRLRLLSSKSLIEHLVAENAQGLDMYIRSPHDALHYCGRKYGVMLSYPERDKCLNELLRNNKIKLVADWNEDKYIEKDEYGDEDVVFWGNLDINFTYRPENGKPIHLQWYRGRSSTEYDIYLMNEDWTYKIRPTPLEDEKGDRKRLYCFNLHIDESSGKSLADQFCKQVETEFAEFIKNPAE